MAMLAERFGDITFLALGMAWVAIGLMIIGVASSFLQVLMLTLCAGAGGSVQHPVASAFVSREYEGASVAAPWGSEFCRGPGQIGRASRVCTQPGLVWLALESVRSRCSVPALFCDLLVCLAA